MPASILVAYATRYGSTQEVAEAIAATLREVGLEVAVQPMRKVQNLAAYGAVVLGAPLYIGAWHKDALDFLSRQRAALTQRPVAIFALGPISTDEKELQGSRAQLDNELAKFQWLRPVAVEVFAGKYDPAKLNFGDRLIARLPASPLYHAPACDARDWARIRAWASSLAAQLQPVPA